jgi:hypothetical protein
MTMECVIDAPAPTIPAAKPKKPKLSPEDQKRRKLYRAEQKAERERLAPIKKAERERRERARLEKLALHKRIGQAYEQRAASLPPLKTKLLMDEERAREDKRLRKRIKKLAELRKPPPERPQQPEVVRLGLPVRQAIKNLKPSAMTIQEARAVVANLGVKEDAPEVIRRPESWTAEYVGIRMIEAFTTLRAMPMRIWPAKVRTCMPESRMEMDDLVARKSLHSILEPPRVEVASSEQMIRMEEAIAWPMQFLRGLEDEFLSRAVVCGALWRATGTSISKKCRRHGVSRTTFYDRMHAGHTIIAINLIANGCPVS